MIAFENAGVIPPEELDVIFEKFYRRSPSRSSETGGASFGLAIAGDIVTLHGGTIHADSVGGQTVFPVMPPLR